MSDAVDISYTALALCFILLIFPILFDRLLKLKSLKRIIISVVRMTVQLLLIGIFLGYIFDLNNPLLNIAWFALMIVVATITVIQNSKLNVRLLLGPAVASFTLVAAGVLIFFNAVVIGLENIFDAKYFIAIGGMILGNSLRANIVGLTTFYRGIRKDEQGYLYRLGMGATFFEGIRPYFKESISRAFAPIMATMATTGIVSLPGMMTGQILGGSEPMVAVKYQIAIMIAIFSSLTMSTGLSIFMTLKVAFADTGILRRRIFRDDT